MEKDERHLYARMDGWTGGWKVCSDMYILLDSEASKGEEGSNISKRIDVFTYCGHIHE